jgi:hypothetical protein
MYLSATKLIFIKMLVWGGLQYVKKYQNNLAAVVGVFSFLEPPLQHNDFSR